MSDFFINSLGEAKFSLTDYGQIACPPGVKIPRGISTPTLGSFTPGGQDTVAGVYILYIYQLMFSENIVFSGLFMGFLVKGIRKKIQRQD